MRADSYRVSTTTYHRFEYKGKYYEYGCADGAHVNTNVIWYSSTNNGDDDYVFGCYVCAGSSLKNEYVVPAEVVAACRMWSNNPMDHSLREFIDLTCGT